MPDPVLSAFSTFELKRLLRLLEQFEQKPDIPINAEDERTLTFLIAAYNADKAT